MVDTRAAFEAVVAVAAFQAVVAVTALEVISAGVAEETVVTGAAHDGLDVHDRLQRRSAVDEAHVTAGEVDIDRRRRRGEGEGDGVEAVAAIEGVDMRATVEQVVAGARSEEHTSELQSLMRISYAVFCLKKKKQKHEQQWQHHQPKQHK